ncbi:MAG: 16S rRNA (cytosine(967)-C(5))-methyltransferase RsmB [Gemmatimonadota bacterium]
MSRERRRALEILRAVRRGARADESFRQHAAGLDPRQRHLVMELSYGTIRWRLQLDYQLSALLKERPLRALPPDVVLILELGAYQLLHMNRIPTWSAVDESVTLARTALPGRVSAWAAGLINAVLRALARARAELTLAVPDPAHQAEHLAIVHSHPPWLVERWLERFGAEATTTLLTRNNQPPPLHLQVNPRVVSPAELLERFRAAGTEGVIHPLKPDAIVLGGGTSPVDLPGWDAGAFWVQDAGSQWVTDAAGPAPVGATLLDACAAPGMKLCGLLAAAPGARALAVDLDPVRLARVRENLSRLGLAGAWTAAADARQLPTAARFPLVLADVPCSGTGVLRRRVDARWRRTPSDLHRFADFQRELLERLAPRVAPGGALVYATCSLEAEENEDVVAGFLEAQPDFRVVPVEDRVPAALREGPYLAARPWRGDWDGLFAARLERMAA